ncbi:MAG: glycosyltransferase [Terracidiphilus sp.]|jgi:glycosyltransferase involved in cell wall biosynthesis
MKTFCRISVVVPSFNQARYLELTLRSILDQNYRSLELIVIDGGSNDGSADIIRKHAKHMKYWCSEPDGGQAQGIIKGFSHATGEILCFLNSDDLFEPGALHEAGEYFDMEIANAQQAGHRLRECGLACAAQSGEPHYWAGLNFGW